MNITEATYGGKNCLTEVLHRVKDGKLIIRSDNSIIGDPMVGIKKSLILKINGENFVIEEGSLFTYPKTVKDKIGIFYSNNNNPKIYPVIRASLKSIQKASAEKADIFTCMWNHEEENPFPEYLAWTQTSSHLNQLLQIMQLLYVAREINHYKYVSFLEHDVLYPEGYFDYPELSAGEILTNMNYIGMNKHGFQMRNQNDEPFHQMTMNFDEAIKHCESILVNALITNSGLIEPQKLKRSQWMCKNPSVHVNHGSHFTSHYSIYKLGEEQTQNDYWGKLDNYIHLFKD